MNTQFRTWTEGLAALRERAASVRGVIEEDGASWPATTNGDVLTIVSVIDPSFQARFRSSELGRRWAAVCDDVWRAALARRRSAYADNRALWSTLAEVCDYLDAYPVPDLWGVLADHLGDAELRNAHRPVEDGPFAHFEAATYDDLWTAQRDYLAERRGFDVPAPPPGFGLPGLRIPRSTNADVLQLATYWTNALARAPHAMGHDGVLAKWNAALADVEQYAKHGAPDVVYPKNSELWRRMFAVAVQIAAASEAPSRFDLFVDSLAYSVQHLPSTLSHAASATADFVTGAARSAGSVLGEAGKGLVGAIGKTPLVVGGGLLGLYFLTRSRAGRTAS